MLRMLNARFKRIGLQWRIMIYVTAGLIAFSVVYAAVALQAVEQASGYVFHERLSIARSLAHEIDEQFPQIQSELSSQPSILGSSDPNRPVETYRLIANQIGTRLDLEQDTYHIELLNESGFTIYSNVEGRQFTTSPHWRLVETSALKRQAGTLTHPVPNGEHVIAFAPLRDAPWIVIIEQSTSEAFIQPRRLAETFVVFGLIAVFGGLALAFITTRRVVRPVNALIRASNAITRGDLDHSLDVSGEGEIGTLARAFDEMRVQLKASNAEIARWNQELEGKVNQRTRELAALVESSHALTSTLDLDALFEILMKETRTVVPFAEGIALFLSDAETQILEVRSSFGFDPSASRQLRFRVGEGVAGGVFKSQTPVLLQSEEDVRAYQENLSVDNGINFRLAIRDRSVKSALGVPLIAKDTRLGVLMLYNFTTEAAFHESDAPILQALANQAATALDNARLFKEASQVGALRELDRLKSEFVARASHELRTPLTSIKSLAETLLRADLALNAGTRREFLRGIDSASDRLSGIVNDLLMLARIEHGRLEVRREPIELGALIGRVVAQFAAEFPSHHIFARLPPDVPSVLGDAEHLEDVLRNLLSNAVKYSEAGTNIGVTAQSSRGTVVISVSDEGIGIPRDEWQRVFERFYRVDNALTRRVGGAGLGLYICKSFVEAMHGSIEVQNNDGRGTVFSLGLPIA